jgi:tRNA modification GTPase
VHDTAGVRDAAGRVEAKGIARTEEVSRSADIILDLACGSAGAMTGGRSSGNAVILKVRTKADLHDGTETSNPGLSTSSVTGEGVDDLWRAIEQSVETFELQKAVRLGVVMNERHRHKLESSRRELARLLEDFSDPLNAPGNDVAGTLLASILSGLGEISGRVFSEHLLESVFSRFCVGK